MLGADVDFLLPDRFKLGYGLSPEIVDLALASGQLPQEHDFEIIGERGTTIERITSIQRVR